jgi:membrane fusion protein (multidrug efflux system)
MCRYRNSAPFLTCLLSLLLAQSAAMAESFECLVEPYLEVNVSSGVPGVIEEVLVDRGAVVSNGDVLVRLKSDLARANYEVAQARAEFAARNVERNRELYLKQMISIHEKDEMETELQLLQLELREAEERLKLRTIKSPLDAVVVKRFFSAGEFVQDEPILALAQVDPLRIEVAIPVRLYGKIQVGMTASVQWEVPVGHVKRARVTIVDPVVDAASGTIGVRLELPNKARELPAGTKCRVTFPIGKN